MAMLDRIKRGQLDGFKEFVLSMEITASSVRQNIFVNGVLEDPVYMDWVMKNLKTFDDFLTLPSDDITTVLASGNQIMSVFAKAVWGSSQETILSFESVFPRLMSKFKDELSLIQNTSPAEKESARFYIVKTARKLQAEDKIGGFDWKLPPQDVFQFKTFKDGIVKIYFDSGVLAAEGGYLKGKRFGTWKHFYDSGKVLGEGDYSDGLKTGLWQLYYGNGGPRGKGKFKADLKHGRWVEWDRRGNEAEVDYNEGVKVEEY